MTSVQSSLEQRTYSMGSTATILDHSTRYLTFFPCCFYFTDTSWADEIFARSVASRKYFCQDSTHSLDPVLSQHEKCLESRALATSSDALCMLFKRNIVVGLHLKCNAHDRSKHWSHDLGEMLYINNLWSLSIYEWLSICSIWPARTFCSHLCSFFTLHKLSIWSVRWNGGCHSCGDLSYHNLNVCLKVCSMSA